MEAQRRIEWEGPMPDEAVFKGGQTGNKIEQITAVANQLKILSAVIIQSPKKFLIFVANPIYNYTFCQAKNN